MKNWTVGKLITLGFAAVLAIMIVLGAFSLFKLRTIRSQFGEISEREVPGLDHSLSVRALINEHMALTYQHICSTSAEVKSQYEARMAEISEETSSRLGAYEKLINDAEERAAYDETKATRANYRETHARILKASRAAMTPQASAKVFGRAQAELAPVSEEYVAAMAKFVDTAKQGVATGRLAAGSAIRSTNWAVLIGSLAAAAAGVVMAYFIARSVGNALKRVSNTIADASAQVSAAAAQVSGASQSLAEGSSEQAASLEETSSSIVEITSISQSTNQRTKELNQVMQAVGENFQQIDVERARLSGALSEGIAAAEQTARIIKTIDEIAFQTNILALNAAVEAARAGEAGAGFAVVADEVRNLAQRAAQAAKDTQALIEKSLGKNRESHQVFLRVEDLMARNSEAAGRVVQAVRDVSAAMEEQSQGLGQVGTAVTQMDKVTQANAANAEETASAAEELNAQATVLLDSVGELQRLVGGVSTGAPSTATRPRPELDHFAPEPTRLQPMRPAGRPETNTRLVREPNAAISSPTNHISGAQNGHAPSDHSARGGQPERRPAV